MQLETVGGKTVTTTSFDSRKSSAIIWRKTRYRHQQLHELHMGLHALGVGHGDEVILSDINWIATAAPVIHLGATPVLVDIEPHSWCSILLRWRLLL